ncbi:MAG: DNA polymerase III subunit epsilon [Rhodoferax sp.]
MRQIFLDTETTGLYASNGDRIIEIGCVELVNRKLTGNNLHFYLNPGRESHEEALRVHGITSAFLRDKPQFDAIVADLLGYVKDAEIIIHNAPFDLGFLNVELELSGHRPFRDQVATVVDSLAMAKEMFPGKRNSLDALCDRLGVDRSGRSLHGALLDAQLLADVYIHLTRGQDALVMDVEPVDHAALAVAEVDLRVFDLPVLKANAKELAEHEEVINQIDKSSAGKAVWRKVT